MIDKLFGTGGLLRVRAVLSIILTAIGGAYLLLFEEMPPSEYNLIWLASIMHYFATRGASN